MSRFSYRAINLNSSPLFKNSNFTILIDDSPFGHLIHDEATAKSIVSWCNSAEEDFKRLENYHAEISKQVSDEENS